MISHQNTKFIFNVNMLNDIMMNYLQTMHIQIMKQQQQNMKFWQMMTNIRIKTTTITSTLIFSNSLHKKSKTWLLKIELYDEKNLVLYFQFKFKIRIKLFIDKKTIDDEKNQLWYVFNFLNNETIDCIHFWIKIVSSSLYTKKFTLKTFLQQIKTTFLNSIWQNKILFWFNILKQNIHFLKKFLSKFDQLLLKTKKIVWINNVKKIICEL